MNAPRVAEAMLRALLSENDELSEAMLGDMAEGWHARASTLSARVADRWYWQHTICSLPSLVAMWCQTVGLRRLTATAAIAVVARLFMLVLQYAALAVGAAAMPDRSNAAIVLAIVASCIGAAMLMGYVVRRISARDASVRIGALSTVVLVLHVVSPGLIQPAMPTRLFWLTTAPLSAIAVIIGAAVGRRRRGAASV